ncbi:MAG: hypothetical protein GWN53_17180 [Gammaproteobacteria bacterium]|uniref:Class I SAM-dependent methyltransferase n=1 Tax=Candidatus Kutchimonas denitrificans TaxID=3056748 RepID=A0AAE4ZAS4_9BACT|nr:class I SAM-dependent methyltransferase [Candidatus Kutchimonas denitrificans]NIV53575.1 hypothetical protein [Gammaproteobacteria bacterium]
MTDEEILRKIVDGTPDSDIREHLPTLYRLTVDLDARRVLELGVKYGNSTLAFLMALHETGGHLTSVDIELPRVAYKRIKRRGWLGRWTLRWRDDREYEWEHDTPPDIVFIDSSHAYEHTAYELDAFGGLATGAVVLHDTHENNYPGVRKALDEWLDGKDVEVEEHEKQHGLTIVYP